MSTGSGNGRTRPVSVGIVGAGFGGVGMGIRLRQAGIEDFTIFERGDSVGGVWRANTYPGAACDVPSHLYSFSFAPGHHWSRRYAPAGGDPRATSRTCTRDYGLEPHLRLGHRGQSRDVRRRASGRWTLETDRRRASTSSTSSSPPAGSSPARRSPRSRASTSSRATPSTRPSGTTTTTCAGERVAVIGTGASAIQFVPADRAAGRAADDLPALGALGRCRSPTARYPEWERRLFRAFPPRVAASRLGTVRLLRGRRPTRSPAPTG